MTMPHRTRCAWWLAMSDAPAVLASLDRFIERFARHGKLIIGHRMANPNQSMAKSNPLTGNAISHFGHFGHRKQETCAGAPPNPYPPHPPPAVISCAGLSRKVLFFDGKNGQSGQSALNQGVGGG